MAINSDTSNTPFEQGVGLKEPDEPNELKKIFDDHTVVPLSRKEAQLEVRRFYDNLIPLSESERQEISKESEEFFEYSKRRREFLDCEQ